MVAGAAGDTPPSALAPAPIQGPRRIVGIDHVHAFHSHDVISRRTFSLQILLTYSKYMIDHISKNDDAHHGRVS